MGEQRRYLITGFAGFVSRHFLEYLENNQIQAMILGVDIEKPRLNKINFKYLKIKFKKVNLLNNKQVSVVVRSFKPNYLLHLASISSVAYSWQDPVHSFLNNTNIFLNVLEAIKENQIKCKILSIGSSEEYGNVTKQDIPLKESQGLAPVSPYAVARVSQELLSQIYADGYKLDIVLTRSFNHIGPQQKANFVISSLIKQFVLTKKNNLKTAVIKAGDIDIVRDFVDVRDVVRAYDLLFTKGQAGEIYNVCSGQGHSIKEIILKIAKLMKMKVIIKVDKKLFRPSDNKIIIGSNQKLFKTTKWQPRFSLEESLQEMINYWEAELL